MSWATRSRNAESWPPSSACAATRALSCWSCIARPSTLASRWSTSSSSPSVRALPRHRDDTLVEHVDLTHALLEVIDLAETMADLVEVVDALLHRGDSLECLRVGPAGRPGGLAAASAAAAVATLELGSQFGDLALELGDLRASDPAARRTGSAARRPWPTARRDRRVVRRRMRRLGARVAADSATCCCSWMTMLATSVMSLRSVANADAAASSELSRPRRWHAPARSRRAAPSCRSVRNAAPRNRSGRRRPSCSASEASPAWAASGACGLDAGGSSFGGFASCGNGSTIGNGSPETVHRLGRPTQPCAADDRR